jgi:hypothetical protein
LISVCPACHRELEAELDWCVAGNVIVCCPNGSPLTPKFRELAK